MATCWRRFDSGPVSRSAGIARNSGGCRPLAVPTASLYRVLAIPLRDREFDDGNLNPLLVARGTPEDITAGFTPLFLRKTYEDEITTRLLF